eukprot:Blabericola_migrator_1__5552@NODE_2829_length_2307_cov_343_400893_g1775_i0_p2_GENE_NODE_2829_length_2307_cov_343_400893_g1775_i0NODE_2829_length_2307_cov_343_400893_g1775_i0_p2_ORF_typecomplete_len252_score62_03_NODE_2829_length_2307_cov_343_400893_g1775_i061816
MRLILSSVPILGALAHGSDVASWPHWDDTPFVPHVPIEIQNVIKNIETSAREAWVCFCRMLLATMPDESSTEDVSTELTQPTQPTQSTQSLQPNPCADHYCATMLDDCSPITFGQLEVCVVQKHPQCYIKVPDLTDRKEMSDYFAESARCAALLFMAPTDTPTDTPKTQKVNPHTVNTRMADTHMVDMHKLSNLEASADTAVEDMIDEVETLEGDVIRTPWESLKHYLDRLQNLRRSSKLQIFGNPVKVTE